MRNEPRDEHPDYTEQEWIDLEAELQEELNWLGARKGKGKVRGAREKGKGKGKTGKGSGACFWARGVRPRQGRLQKVCGSEVAERQLNQKGRRAAISAQVEPGLLPQA